MSQIRNVSLNVGDFWKLGSLQSVAYHGSPHSPNRAESRFEYGDGQQGAMEVSTQGVITVSSDTDNDDTTGDTRLFKFDAKKGWTEQINGKFEPITEKNLNDKHSFVTINPQTTSISEDGTVKYGFIDINVGDKNTAEAVVSRVKLYGSSAQDKIDYLPEESDGFLYASVYNTDLGDNKSFSEIKFDPKQDLGSQIKVTGGAGYDGTNPEKLADYKPNGDSNIKALGNYLHTKWNNLDLF